MIRLSINTFGQKNNFNLLSDILLWFQILPGESEEVILNKYSWVVALNPIGQVIFSPILGWLSDRLNGVRWIGIGTSVVFIIANILYAILSVFPTNDGRYAALLISRFLTGATSGEKTFSWFMPSN